MIKRKEISAFLRIAAFLGAEKNGGRIKGAQRTFGKTRRIRRDGD